MLGQEFKAKVQGLHVDPEAMVQVWMHGGVKNIDYVLSQSYVY